MSALIMASQDGHIGVVEVLLENNAQVNLQADKGWSALMIASQNGHNKVVKMLIDNCANVNLRSDDGWTALMIASEKGQCEVVKILLEKSTQVQSQKAALKIASKKGHSEVVKLLQENNPQIHLEKDEMSIELPFENEAQIDQQNDDGTTLKLSLSSNQYGDLDLAFTDTDGSLEPINTTQHFATQPVSQQPPLVNQQVTLHGHPTSSTGLSVSLRNQSRSLMEKLSPYNPTMISSTTVTAVSIT